MASLKAKQDDLRRLMKERRENLKVEMKKVDSPFAKYNSVGQLFCTICNVQIKSSGLWTSHIAGSIHKENALKKKKGTVEVVPVRSSQIVSKQLDVQSSSMKKMMETLKLKIAMKGNLYINMPVDTKESFLKPLPVKSVGNISSVKSTGKLSLLDAYSSSEEDDENDTSPTECVTNASSSLPKDFFDAAPVPSHSSNSESSAVAGKSTAIATSNSVEALPEGFFDDPVLDAKARNIEYKDPIEEEWEKYQKAIAEETNVSRTIMEEDLEESTLERDISEIDEQIQQWKRLRKLELLAEAVRNKAPSKDTNMDLSESTDDELDEDDLLDWRSKGIKRR